MELDLYALRDALADAQTLPELSAVASALGLSATEQQVFGAQPYRYASSPSPRLLLAILASALCEAMGWAWP